MKTASLGYGIIFVITAFSCRTSHRKRDEPVFTPEFTAPDPGNDVTPTSPRPNDSPSEPAADAVINPVDFQLDFPYFPGLIPGYPPVLVGDTIGSWIDGFFTARLHLGEDLRKAGGDCTFSSGPVGTILQSYSFTVLARSAAGYYTFIIDDIKPDSSTEAFHRLIDGQVSLSCSVDGKAYNRSYFYPRYIYQSPDAGAYVFRFIRDRDGVVTSAEVKVAHPLLQIAKEISDNSTSVVLKVMANAPEDENSGMNCFMKRKICGDKEWTSSGSKRDQIVWEQEYFFTSSLTQMRMMCIIFNKDERQFDYSDIMEFPGSIPCSTR